MTEKVNEKIKTTKLSQFYIYFKKKNAIAIRINSHLQIF